MLDFLCIFVHGRMRADVVVLIPGASRDGVAGSKLNNGHLCIWVRGGCGLGICPLLHPLVARGALIITPNGSPGGRGVDGSGVEHCWGGGIMKM